MGRSSRRRSSSFIPTYPPRSAAPGGGEEPVGELSGVVHGSLLNTSWRWPPFISSSPIRGGRKRDAPAFPSDWETTGCRLRTGGEPLWGVLVRSDQGSGDARGITSLVPALPHEGGGDVSLSPGWKLQGLIPTSQYADQDSPLIICQAASARVTSGGVFTPPGIKTRGLFDPPVCVRKVRGAP